MLIPGSGNPAAAEEASAEIELLGPRVRPEPSADRGGDERHPARDALVCELVAELLRSGQAARLRVIGTSMLPTLWPGDRLRVEAADPGSLQRGGWWCAPAEVASWSIASSTVFPRKVGYS